MSCSLLLAVAIVVPPALNISWLVRQPSHSKIMYEAFSAISRAFSVLTSSNV